jgi:3-phenylpropionate/trans-cinnamate dioxygenase ferredoxin reductase subunit
LTPAGVVIVGAGQAGLQVAASLRDGHYAGPITLVGDEAHLPYGRPPLSKAFLKGADTTETLSLRPQSFIDRHKIVLRSGVAVAAIDRERRLVMMADGEAFAFETLVLATGARNRPLPVPGAGLDGVFSLRGTDDAMRLRTALAAARAVVVVGGGFLGLEVASTAAAAGCAVTVIEAGPRLMGRAVSPPISDDFLRRHIASGVTILLNESVVALTEADGRVASVQLRSGAAVPADLVLVAIGVVPNVELAVAAGLAIADGIVVDAAMRTADPAIYAVGDCALHPNKHAGGPVRLESVQNAMDQARCAASNILGTPAHYTAVPWFWSDQAGAKLQIAGLRGDADQFEMVGEGDAFSVYCSRAGRLVCVESVNRPLDHAKARKQLGTDAAALSTAA